MYSLVFKLEVAHLWKTFKMFVKGPDFCFKCHVSAAVTVVFHDLLVFNAYRCLKRLFIQTLHLQSGNMYTNIFVEWIYF